jgi:hypothetical protein
MRVFNRFIAYRDSIPFGSRLSFFVRRFNK